jgi:hypothetical protein
MKLFITNQKGFKESFDREELRNSTRNYLTSSEIHKKAFATLFESVNNDSNIPIVITTSYDDGDGCAIFIFNNRKNDVYFYEYSGTAS